jgi:hypothetical protein
MTVYSLQEFVNSLLRPQLPFHLFLTFNQSLVRIMGHVVA